MARLPLLPVIPRLFRAAYHSSAPALPHPPALSSLATPEDHELARAWISAFTLFPASHLPRDSLEITYSRSSGPGGQNVNKLSTKATTRLLLSRASYLPPYLLPALSRTPYFLPIPPSLLLSSSVHRTQPQNLEDCLGKLKSVVLGAAREGLVGATSEGQRRRVVGLEKAEKRRMEEVKKARKEVKSGRRSGGSGWD